jgi:transposase-like protein
MLQTDLYSFSYKKGSLLPWCKKCGAQHFYRNGKNKSGITRYKCRNCGFRFVWTSDLPRRNYFSSIMSFAVELYTSLRIGISLRGVSKILKKAFNVKVSYEGIRQWILASKPKLSRLKKIVSSTWHADETYFKIKGKGYWLWVVFCADSKQVLSWHISKARLFKDAKHVLQKALDVVKIKPEKVITDGLFQYDTALKKVMHWRLHERRKKHVVDTAIGKNAIIERLNREIKRRIKWFSTFQSLKGAQAFFGLWFYHYNLVKS